MGVNGGTLTLAKLDEAIDLVKGGKPDVLLMSKRTRRTLNNLARTSGGFLEADRNEFGQMVQFYDGIPVGICDYVSDAKTVGTSNDCSTVYAARLGEGALAGLTSPGGLQVERVGSLETKDATRTRIKWYCSMALFNAANLLSSIGMTVPKYSRNRSGCWRKPSSIERKITPCFSRCSWIEWYTISDSYYAPSPARTLRSASGTPSLSNVRLMSSGTSSQDFSLFSVGLT